jgi:hypothetical protein
MWRRPEGQRAYRARQKANGIPRGDVAELHERLALSLKLEAPRTGCCPADGTQYPDRSRAAAGGAAQPLRLLKDIIGLKQAAAAPACSALRLRPTGSSRDRCRAGASVALHDQASYEMWCDKREPRGCWPLARGKPPSHEVAGRSVAD